MPLKAKQTRPGHYEMEGQEIARHSADPKKKVNAWTITGKQTRYRRLLDAMQHIAFDLQMKKAQQGKGKLKKGHNPNQLTLF